MFQSIGTNVSGDSTNVSSSEQKSKPGDEIRRYTVSNILQRVTW
jgi:hypothetical protein